MFLVHRACILNLLLCLWLWETYYRVSPWISVLSPEVCFSAPGGNLLIFGSWQQTGFFPGLSTGFVCPTWVSLSCSSESAFGPGLCPASFLERQCTVTGCPVGSTSTPNIHGITLLLSGFVHMEVLGFFLVWIAKWLWQLKDLGLFLFLAVLYALSHLLPSTSVPPELCSSFFPTPGSLSWPSCSHTLLAHPSHLLYTTLSAF